MDLLLSNCSKQIAENLFANASAHAELLDDRLGLGGADAEFMSSFLEFVAFLFHVCVTRVHDEIGSEEGGRLVNLVFAHLNSLGTAYSLSEKHTQPPFVRTEAEGRIQIVGINSDLVNLRHVEYCKIAAAPGQDATARMRRLTSAFGVHVSDAYPRAIDRSQVQKYAADEGVVSCSQFMASLKLPTVACHDTRDAVLTYGPGTNVLCKVCRMRRIFLQGPIRTIIRDGKRYLELKCPSGTCAQKRLYEENELEIQ